MNKKGDLQNSPPTTRKKVSLLCRSSHTTELESWDSMAPRSFARNSPHVVAAWWTRRNYRLSRLGWDFVLKVENFATSSWLRSCRNLSIQN
jgi:hypothetical protein